MCVFCVVPGIEPLCETTANWKSLLLEDISKAGMQMLVNYPILLTYMVVVLM